MIAGIDLGTSSVKIICVDKNGEIQKARYSYQENSINEWIRGIQRAFAQLDTKNITAVSLSSQVGTYVMNDRILSWQEPGGEAELQETLDAFSTEEFVEEISMVHPALLSYPIPRIRYMLKQNADAAIPKKICQPKEIICEYLTGNYVSDPYSYRGLANQSSQSYSHRMLEYMQIQEEIMPKLQQPFAKAGTLREEAAKACGVKEGIPVYVGCNDFYASLLGMGIAEVGDSFDVTGTSEHMGVITSELLLNRRMISSPFIKGNVAYGVTGSSGASLEFALRELGLNNISYEKYRHKKNMPIFLPYLNGERAPIYDSGAKGVFFGISGDTSREDMAYAVMEGVAFSVWHIMEALPDVGTKQIITSGGAAKNRNLLQLKADLFKKPFVRAAESDTSAYGACMIGAVGEGWYPDVRMAAEKMCRYDEPVIPRENKFLKERFALYKNIYKDLKKEFKEFRRINQ